MRRRQSSKSCVSVQVISPIYLIEIHATDTYSKMCTKYISFTSLKEGSASEKCCLSSSLCVSDYGKYGLPPTSAAPAAARSLYITCSAYKSA